MLFNMKAGLRWNISLGMKFLRVVPYPTLTIVLLTLVSQIAMLVASFLPLKVIIMLGSERIPRYFPATFAALERDVLIAALSAGTIVFFLVYLVAEKLIESTTGYATSRLLARSQKMVLFENQEAVAASSYQRYSHALASGVFLGLAVLGLGWFYPTMALVIIGYLLFSLLLFWQAARRSTGFRDRLKSKLAQYMSVSATAGVFVAFGYLVIDFVFLSPPGMIVALVSFLLIRQALQRAAGMITDLSALYWHKPKLNALFFHGQVFQPRQADAKKNLWPLLMPETRQNWVAEVLNTVAGEGEGKGKGESEGELSSRWHQLGNPNVVGLLATRGEQQFLLKLYEPNRSSLALHEADLMAELPQHLPAACWVGTVPVDKFHCLVYQLQRGQHPTPSKVGTHIQELRGLLLAAAPGREVTQRYMRSKAMLWQRLNQEMLERLQFAVTNADQQRDLDALLAQLPALQHQLSVIPLAILNTELSQDTIWLPAMEDGQTGEAILLNWGSWTLEPAGAGWPEADASLHTLAETLTTAATKRPELTDIKAEQAELAALAFALERECNRQRYVQALELVPRILKRFGVLEKAASVKLGEAG